MKNYISILLLVIANMSFGQYDLSFYQMGNATPQHNNYNASWFPKARGFFCLPVLSGLDIGVNNSFGIGDVLTPTGDSTLIDIKRFLANREGDSQFSADMKLTLMMMGFRTGKNGFITIFANENVQTAVTYPFSLVDFVWEGNGEFIGENYVSNDFSIGLNVYHEVGMGIGRDFMIGGKKLSVGIRGKYLMGLAHVSFLENPEINILTRDDYSINVSVDKGEIRSVGRGVIDEISSGESQKLNDQLPYLYSNKNTGMAFDIGLNMDVTERINVSFAANDIGGSISWNDSIQSYTFDGAGFEIAGSSFDKFSEIGTAISDSVNALEDKIQKVAEPFSTKLNSKIYLSAKYKLVKGGYAQLSLANYNINGSNQQVYGAGYLQEFGKWFAGSVTGTYSPVTGADFGAGLMLRGAPVQFYLNVSRIKNLLDVTTASSANVKFGLNFFIFGAEQKREK